MVDVVEAGLDVGVEHPHPAPVGRSTRISLEGVVGRTLRSEPETDRGEVGLEDRLEDDLGRRHDHPVARPWGCRAAGSGPACPAWGCAPAATAAGRYAAGPQLVRRVRRGTLALASTPPSSMAAIVTPSTPGAPPVGGHVDPRPPQHVAAGDLVVEGMEPTLRVLLGTAIEHALQGSNRVHTFGVSDGPSRHRRHSSGFLPSSSCIDEAGALRSRGLCCPAGSIATALTSLRLVRTSRSADLREGVA